MTSCTHLLLWATTCHGVANRRRGRGSRGAGRIPDVWRRRAPSDKTETPPSRHTRVCNVAFCGLAQVNNATYSAVTSARTHIRIAASNNHEDVPDMYEYVYGSYIVHMELPAVGGDFVDRIPNILSNDKLGFIFINKAAKNQGFRSISSRRGGRGTRRRTRRSGDGFISVATLRVIFRACYRCYNTP